MCKIPNLEKEEVGFLLDCTMWQLYNLPADSLLKPVIDRWLDHKRELRVSYSCSLEQYKEKAAQGWQHNDYQVVQELPEYAALLPLLEKLELRLYRGHVNSLNIEDHKALIEATRLRLELTPVNTAQRAKIFSHLNQDIQDLAQMPNLTQEDCTFLLETGRDLLYELTDERQKHQAMRQRYSDNLELYNQLRDKEYKQHGRYTEEDLHFSNNYPVEGKPYEYTQLYAHSMLGSKIWLIENMKDKSRYLRDYAVNQYQITQKDNLTSKDQILLVESDHWLLTSMVGFSDAYQQWTQTYNLLRQKLCENKAMLTPYYELDGDRMRGGISFPPYDYGDSLFDVLDSFSRNFAPEIEIVSQKPAISSGPA